jgi:hypothetical protein
MHEQSRRVQLGKMRGAELRWFLGRMERVREQQEPGGKVRVFGGQHTSLAATVGMTTKKHGPGSDLAQRFERTAQSCAVDAAISKGRPVGTRLPEWQIASQDSDSGAGKNFGCRYE